MTTDLMTVEQAREASKAPRFPVVEIFGPTIEGEGVLSGQPTHFIRFGFCDGAGIGGWCIWCDSMFAVDPKNKSEWRWMTAVEICDELRTHQPAPWVKLSGGNPLLHDLENLVIFLQSYGFKVSAETQGTIVKPWVTRLDQLVLSPKPPSAGSPWTIKREECFDTIMSMMWGRPLCVKIVCDPDQEDDRQFVKQMYDITYPGGGKRRDLSFYVTCLTQPDDTRDALGERYRRLAEWAVTADMPRAAVGLQLHVIAWMHRTGV